MSITSATRPWNIADFLILRAEMPRSLRFSYDWLSIADRRPLHASTASVRLSADLVAETRDMLKRLDHGDDLRGRACTSS